MNDVERDKKILFLLKVWFYLTERNTVWPGVKRWVEQQLNEELPE